MTPSLLIHAAMLIAFFTDLHANREALEACLAHAAQRNVGQLAFLGDLVGYGADPAWVVDTVRTAVSRGAWALMGNHDASLFEDPHSNMNPTARAVVDWTRGQLDAEQLEFLRTLPLRLTHTDLLMVHANAWAPERWEYIDGVMEAMRSMHASSAPITLCGHMHTPTLYHMTLTGKTGEFMPTPEHGIPLSRQRRWLVIPGAVGQPRDGNPAACYATLDSTSLELTFYRVPYDHERAAAKVRAAGLPEALAERLRNGA